MSLVSLAAYCLLFFLLLLRKGKVRQFGFGEGKIKTDVQLVCVLNLL